MNAFSIEEPNANQHHLRETVTITNKQRLNSLGESSGETPIAFRFEMPAKMVEKLMLIKY